MQRIAESFSSPVIEKALHSLQECRHKRSPARAKQLLAYMREQQLDAHAVLGNYLVPVLVDCGCLPDAQDAFDRLPHRNAHSWTSLISGYLDRSDLPHALILYRRMQEDSVPPNSYTLVSLLKACTNVLDVEKGQHFHADVITRGLDGDIFVGSTLVDMYGKCGSLPDAQKVFDGLRVRDEVSWNALIAGYTEHGVADTALSLSQQMQQDGFLPDVVTLVCSLKACGILQDLNTGRDIQTKLTKKGMDRQLYVGTTLVDMYANCDSLAEACQVFYKLPVRDTVSWAALVSGYAEHGLYLEVCNCFRQMQQKGVAVDVVTLIHCLKACGTLGALEVGQQIHTEIRKYGLENGAFIGNSLVDMYAKCGSLFEARQVFDKLVAQDVVSWNTLIAGYAEHGSIGQSEYSLRSIIFGYIDHDDLQHTFFFYQKMLLDNVQPNNYTFVALLKVCSRLKDVKKGQGLHAEVIKKGLEGDHFIGNSLVDMYGKHGLLAEAQQVFRKLPDQDRVSWNALIAGYVEHGLDEEALSCFLEMLVGGIPPANVTFVCSLKACSTTGGVDIGQWLCSEIVKKGLERELFVGSIMVDFYSKHGLLIEAQHILDHLPSRNEVAWTAMIAGYMEHGFDEEALNCFKQMLPDNVLPVVVTFSCSLKACSNAGALETGSEMYTESTKRGIESDLCISNMLIDMYGKCGLLAEGKKVFDMMPSKDVVSWTTIIKLYGENHKGNMAAQCFEDMRQQGVTPNAITFTCLLAACSHASLVAKGQEYFYLMKEECGIEPTLNHYACMVDLLARAGHVYEAKRYSEVMLCYPSKEELLTPMLCGCKVYGEEELGLRCFEKLVGSNQTDASAFTMLADTYANSGRLVDAHRIEECRIHAGVQKKLGSATIEVDKKLHGFVVGEELSKSISEILDNVSSHMKDEGYVPNVDLASAFSVRK